MNKHDSPQQLLTRVNQLAGQKKISEALKLAKTILRQHPKFANAWLTIAFLYFQTNQIDQARKALKKARTLEPNNAFFAFQEVMMLKSINKIGDALSIAKKLARTPLKDHRMNVALAHFLEVNYAFHEAKLLYTYLHKQQPDFSDWPAKLAMIEQAFGNIDAAEKLAQEAISKKPNHANVHFFISHLKKQSKESNHIDELKDIIKQRPGDKTNQSMLYFALAKELEDCGEYSESFKYRKMGADLFRSTLKYDINSDLGFMQEIRKEFDTDFFKDISSKSSDEKPIFIVGLPRSGTTLLDRIISAHSDVTAADEITHMNQGILQELSHQYRGKNLSRNELVRASKYINFKKLGLDYLDNARFARGTTPRFTDKFPQNSYYVGMILKALPGAKIIILQRHPVAVCYSIYKQMFHRDAYPYSYMLEELADYYIEHTKLLKHWQKMAGHSVKTVYYEELVSNLENQTKDILSFLDLSWQPECLNFHKNKQPTATASASQVRQKVYTDSVAMWQNYESELQPLISKLKAAGCLDTA